MKRKKTIYSAMLPLLTFLCIVAIWSVASSAVNSEYVLPSVSKTIEALIELFKDADFYLAFGSTFLRVLIAFACSFILAFLCAGAVNKHKVLSKVINPIVSVLRAFPTVAVVLLLMFWTNSLVAPVIVTMLVVFPVLFTNLCTSFGAVDTDVVQMCALFNVEKKKVFYRVKLPAMLPTLMLSIGSGISLNLKLMVAAEVLAATANSLGSKLSFANYNLQVATMIALVLVTVITGVIIESVFNLISKKVGAWK